MASMLDGLNWPDGVIVREIEVGWNRKRARQFLRWPDLLTLRQAANLPGKAGWVWLLISHRTTVTKSEWVTLPQSWMDEWGIDRSSKSRALTLLQKAGLIEVECEVGHSARTS
jgi:hypothetical protein